MYARARYHFSLLSTALSVLSALRLSEVVENEAHLVAGEELLNIAVARAEEHVGELRVVVDPVHQTVHGTLRGEMGRVGHGEFRLAHRAYATGLDFFLFHITIFVVLSCCKDSDFL